MSDTNKKGEVGELFVALEATQKGYYVARMPQDCPYDMVIDRGNGPERVQVKYCTEKDNSIYLIIDSCKQRRRTYTINNIDAFAIYVPGRGVHWLDAKEVCGKVRTVTMRTQPARNGQTKDVRMLENYSEW